MSTILVRLILSEFSLALIPIRGGSVTVTGPGGDTESHTQTTALAPSTTSAATTTVAIPVCTETTGGERYPFLLFSEGLKTSSATAERVLVGESNSTFVAGFYRGQVAFGNYTTPNAADNYNIFAMKWAPGLFFSLLRMALLFRPSKGSVPRESFNGCTPRRWTASQTTLRDRIM